MGDGSKPLPRAAAIRGGVQEGCALSITAAWVGPHPVADFRGGSGELGACKGHARAVRSDAKGLHSTQLPLTIAFAN